MALGAAVSGAAGCAVPSADAPAVDLDEAAEALRLSAKELGAAPRPGAPGVGDVLFPNLGNGGYVVEHYDLALRYATAAPEQALEGTATILARTTQALSRFNLDFSGDAFDAVAVNGRDAGVSWDGEELVVTPARPLARGEIFVVTVRGFEASPRQPDPRVLLGAPFFFSPDGSGWALQPHAAHTIFPCNDHPSDKASFSFRVDVPAGTTAVANGELLGQLNAGGRSVFLYTQLQPMATELAQVAVGAFTVTSRGTHHGVRVRDVTPTRLTAALLPKLAIVLDQLSSLEAQLGEYPFTSYGSLLVDARLGFALETQSLSLYDTRVFDRAVGGYAPLMVHELAHQWFGNSVAPAQWSDVWQNEGHATWYEVASIAAPGSPQHTQLMQSVYSFSDILRADYGAVASPKHASLRELFSLNVYYGGALVLYALRQEVGEATFQQIERTWVARYRGRAASTDDFIALASEVAGRDLTAFLHEWLYSETTPAMPGHPDWTVEPPQSLAATSARERMMTVAPFSGFHRH